MNFFAKSLPPLKPILKQKTVFDEKVILYNNALANVTIGLSLYPNPELLEIMPPFKVVNEADSFQTPKRELTRTESDSHFKKPSQPKKSSYCS